MRMRFQNSRAFIAVLGFVFFLVVPASLEAQEAGAAPADVKIDMSGSKFDPDVAVAQVNATVTWTNRDGFNHDVTGLGNNFSSPGGLGGMAKGATYAVKIDQAGVYDYYCTVHSSGRGNGMWGRLIVMEAPVTALGGGGGGISPEEAGVNWLAHWVGIISFVAVFATLLIYYFVLKFGETMHATDHRDRKEP